MKQKRDLNITNKNIPHKQNQLNDIFNSLLENKTVYRPIYGMKLNPKSDDGSSQSDLIIEINPHFYDDIEEFLNKQFSQLLLRR